MLGLCCHFLEEEIKPKSRQKVFVNKLEERSLQLGRYKDGKYSDEVIKNTYINNVSNLAKMLPKIRKTGIRHFRISSALFPLSDKVNRDLWDNPEVVSYLKIAGDFIKQQGMRVSTHPGQFCVLSSDSDTVIENSFRELSIHGWLFDSMGLDRTTQYAINIHGGKSNRSEKLIKQIQLLPDDVRCRLTLENDENCYSVVDLLQIHRETNTPIVFDSHHHTFNDGGINMQEAFEASCETWSAGIKPLQHISNTEPSLINGSVMDRRKHSDMIHYVPDEQLNALRKNLIDVECEAKKKNLAIFKMSKDFDIPL